MCFPRCVGAFCHQGSTITLFELSLGRSTSARSNTYMHWITEKILGMVMEIFRDPVKMVDDISALGLRHVGYGIPTEYFGPFVTACVDTFTGQTPDKVAIESLSWSIGLVSKMLIRTITEGSTCVGRVPLQPQVLLTSRLGADRVQRCWD